MYNAIGAGQQAPAMLLCCGVALVALNGLYKLRLWGLLLSALTTLSIGILAFTPVLGLSDAGPVPYALSASAAIQIALLAPLFVAIARSRAPPPPSPRTARIAAMIPALVIVALTALSMITFATAHPLVRSCVPRRTIDRPTQHRPRTVRSGRALRGLRS